MDDLTRIPGIGKAAAKKLAEAGIDTFEKLAHDGRAGEHGVKVEWISAAAALLHENTEGGGSPDADPASEGATVPEAAKSDAVGKTAPDTPPSEAAGANSTDTTQPEQGDGSAPQSGAPVAPPHHGGERPAWETDFEASSELALAEFRKALEDGATLDAAYEVLHARASANVERALAERDAFAVAEHDRAAGERSERLEVAERAIREDRTVRISARKDGFRRAGIAHPKAATDHRAARFTPDELERLLAEPMLTVEVV